VKALEALSFSFLLLPIELCLQSACILLCSERPVIQLKFDEALVVSDGLRMLMLLAHDGLGPKLKCLYPLTQSA
jgi:hypothetical protein